MSKRCLLWKTVLSLTLLASMGGLISCVPTPGEEVAVAEPAPRAWIDFPRDGVSVPVGASVIVVSHAYAEDGVAEVMLSVNGTAYRRDPPAASGDTLVEVRQEWVPMEPGLYTLEVRTYGAAGEIISSDAITIRVTGDATESPTEVVAPTEVPVATEVPTATPVATLVPTATPVATLVPTATPVATLVPTATPVPTPVPTATPVPTPIPDTTPPPVPAPVVPADEWVLPCRSSQILAWTPVSDPSGVSYYVKLEYKVTATEWQVVGGYGPLNDKQVEVDVDCGLIYRWTVRAEDGAGNISAWSAHSNFTINLE